jgi:transposase
VIWYHDESIFYAHDRRRRTWYHKDADAIPYKKGDGVSYMVADYFSADFGWLRTPDGKPGARRSMRPGKKRDGYFSAEDIEEQAITACKLVHERWPDYDHVFIYDNATTHRKRGEGALSARAMPKGISGTATGKNKNPDSNFLVPVNKRNPDGSRMYDAHGTLLKEQIRMTGAYFADGSPQELYFPADADKHAGKFKGMELILEERRRKGDLGRLSAQELKKKNAECKSFKCIDQHSGTCFMRRMLFTQPDFAAVKSCLEDTCTEFNVTVLFLPKFHCELNPIEMVWGYAKRVYRMNPESSREDVLERNTLSALDQVPLESMRRFVIRAHRFADAYRQGLDGPQAAWAARKYKGHRVLPPEFKTEMLAAGILRGGNPNAGL